LIFCIKDSGLYDIIDEIRCCILGDDYDETLFIDDPKIKIRAASRNLMNFEVFTINALYDDAQKEDFRVLYLHTKGVKHDPSNMCVKTWVDYLCYFNIYQHKKCIELLNDYDTSGANLQDKPTEKCHYSGNFWWTKSSYLRKLDRLSTNTYHSPEFWLTEKKGGRFVSLWHSNCPHYCEPYPKEKYENRPIVPYTVFDYVSDNDDDDDEKRDT
jgi:hypothetical protein